MKYLLSIVFSLALLSCNDERWYYFDLNTVEGRQGWEHFRYSSFNEVNAIYSQWEYDGILSPDLDDDYRTRFWYVRVKEQGSIFWCCPILSYDKYGTFKGVIQYDDCSSEG